MRFVMDHETGLWTMTELCRRHGISRPTGYELVERFGREGVAGLADRKRAPERHPNQLAVALAERILELRRQHSSWGARKLRAYLERKHPRSPWPVASTIGELLKREGLSAPRRKRRRTPPYTQPFVTVDGPNQTWCMDFKGWFRTRDGERIDPFTMSDAFSRSLLRCQAVERSNTEQVQAIMEAAFREYGMPVAVRSDNGPPFASRALAGLCRLSVYLLKLGIVAERIQPGHPEQNGRHERMHRTLQAEAANPPARNRREQQQKLESFRREYNQERPHEALGQQTPASCYCASPRPFPGRVPEPEYDHGMAVRTVQEHGQFPWKMHDVFLSKALRGERIALLPIDDRYYQVYFCSSVLGRFDSHQRRVEPLQKYHGEKRGR